MLYIYTLELENNKYFVGKTTNPNFRFETHFDYKGNEWTTKYKPIKLIELIEGCDNFDEDKYTLKYMSKYGIDNVRGGSFCQTVLNEEYMNTIEKMIFGLKIANNNNDNDNDKDNDKDKVFNYDEYIDKFNNLQEINNEMIELEKQFEYIQILNKIYTCIDNKWKLHIKCLNKLSEKIIIHRKENKFTRIMNEYIIFSQKMNLRFNFEFSEKDLCNNLLYIVDNIKNNDKLTLNTFVNKKKNFVDHDQLKFIFDPIFDLKDITGWLDIIKSKFVEYIQDKNIDLDINSSLQKWNIVVKINKLCLFLLQLENEIKRLYDLHQVENNKIFEQVMNKKMEILTEKAIKN